MFMRLIRYFICFTVMLMAMIWILQVLFLQTFYQQMKIHQLYSLAEKIESGYGSENLYDTISALTARSDIYIQIDYDGATLYSTSSYQSGKMNFFASTYNADFLKSKLDDSDKDHIVVQEHMVGTDSQAMVYASVLDKDELGNSVYLMIYSPLTAVGSTISILAELLVIITIVSMLFGLIMAIFIARRLSRPINNITREAEKLAQGDYNNTVFDGTGYAETEELAATLNYASDELSKADKLQKDLIANVSHDLKTPLTMVKSYAEMIRDISGEKKEKRERHLQVIINEADRLNELVNDLVTLSKMQANVDALTLEDVNLEQAARETLDSFSLHTEQDGFTMELQVEGATDVSCDSKKIRQVFANLIGNAVRYSSDDKYIMVKLTERADSVLCEVVDHGQGIPPEDQESVWDRYYQSSSNHSRTSQGTGLGLSIVKQILIQHRAEFGVRSKLNEGSDFWFELPKDPLMKR